MISEPEIVGQSGETRGPDVVGGFDREPGRRRSPWLWAAGGAVMASALWAAAWYAYGVEDRGPDLHGYRLDDGLCAALPLESIGSAIAPRQPVDEPASWQSRDGSLDRAECTVPLKSLAAGKRPTGRWSLEYTVSATVELHKKTDPGPEFEVRARETGADADTEEKLEAVPDLGDQAYLRTSDYGSTELTVLEGGAVLTLGISSDLNYEIDGGDGEVAEEDEPDIPDTAPYQPALISDMRDLMALLKQ
ncbi:hypothetical protein ACIRD8_33990 [Streptomyces sp. NPDC102451]|uniref:hypothetical protein n=1 Tax=Streptomyces sp. NPDC102451 TaxID=3366177 RepID=UPI003812DBCB